jgi:hypothetical protein
MKREFLYFARCKSTGLVKVGFSAAPEERVRNLGYGQKSEMVLLRAIRSPNGRQDERIAHFFLAGYRHHGEWFNLTDDDDIEQAIRHVWYMRGAMTKWRKRLDAKRQMASVQS